MLGLDTIQSFFSQYGWKTAYNKACLVTGLITDHNKYVLATFIEEDWLVLLLPEYQKELISSDRARFLMQLMLINTDLNGAKLSMMDDGAIGLSVYLPLTNLTYEAFEVGLDTLCGYAETLYVALQDLLKREQ